MFQTFKGVDLFIAIVFFVVTAIAIAKCLLVVKPRSDKEIERELQRSRLKEISTSSLRKKEMKPDLIFFADIISYTLEDYMRAFKETSIDEIFQQLTRRLYKISTIASIKYRILNSAQNWTLLAAILWLVTMGLLLKNQLGI